MFQRIDTLKTVFFWKNVYQPGSKILGINFVKFQGGKPIGALPMDAHGTAEASSGTGGTNITKSEVASRRIPQGLNGSTAVGSQGFLDNKDGSMIWYVLWGLKSHYFPL